MNLFNIVDQFFDNCTDNFASKSNVTKATI